METETDLDNKWIDTHDAADYINMSVPRLANLRSEGLGPRYYKPLGKVMYLRSDLDEWVKNAKDGKLYD